VTDLIWFAFIAACALAGIGLTLLWIRAREGSDEDLDLDQIERSLKQHKRQQERGPDGAPRRSPSTYRPPPPTPDLISIQEAWRAGDRSNDDEDELDVPYLDGLGRQDRGTPTAPSGPRQGWQLPPEIRRPEVSHDTPSTPPTEAQREASDEATVLHARALDPSELDGPPAKGAAEVENGDEAPVGDEESTEKG